MKKIYFYIIMFRRGGSIIVEPLLKDTKIGWPRNVELKDWYRAKVVKAEWVKQVEENFLKNLFRRNKRRPVKSWKPRDN